MKVLSLKAKKAIDAWLLKFPNNQRQSAVLFALTFVQKENGGWLTVEWMDTVAAYLGMPKIAVYEVASFYSLYELEPVGKYKIMFCTNIACQLSGSEQIGKYLQRSLGIKFGETTADGLFTLKSVECLAACGGAPAMQINDEYYENLTESSIDAILQTLETPYGK